MSATRKTIISAAIIFSLLLATAKFITSCNNAPADGVFIPVPKDTSALSKIDHFIPESQIKEYRSAFAAESDSLARAYPSFLLPDAEAFNKLALIEVLKDPRSVGIRIYHGIKRGKKNEVRLIIVGVDAQGKDILVTKGSAVAAQAGGGEPGGEDHGQCPTCQPEGNN